MVMDLMLALTILILALIVILFIFFFVLYSGLKRDKRETETLIENAMGAIENPKDEVRALRVEIDQKLTGFFNSQAKNMEIFFSRLGELEKSQRDGDEKEAKTINDNFDRIRKDNTDNFNLINQKTEKLTETVRDGLDKIREENSKKIDEIRKTVDEKLQETLEERITKSFKEVQDNLSKLYESLGSLKKLTGDVESINRIFSNVKSRGVWGEEQAEALLSDILSPDQYVRDFSPKKNAEKVEFAIRFPSKDGSESVYLPIDSKFPVSDYERYKNAYDEKNYTEMERALLDLKKTIKEQGNKISKYINAPVTTDFAILFVPVESIFSELLSMGDLMDALEKKRILIAGPTTFSALLNTLRLAFKTMQIESYTSEIWKCFESLKGYFKDMGTHLENTRKGIDKAQEGLNMATKAKDSINKVLIQIEESGNQALLEDPGAFGVD